MKCEFLFKRLRFVLLFKHIIKFVLFPVKKLLIFLKVSIRISKIYLNCNSREGYIRLGGLQVVHKFTVQQLHVYCEISQY